MTKINIVHEGEDYITVLMGETEYEVTGGSAIRVIKTLIAQLARA